MKPDLAALAQQNASRLQEAMDTLIEQAATDHADVVTRFAAVVQHSGVSLNLRNAGLIGLLSTERHLNIHDVAALYAKELGADADKILRRQLGPWYERRIAFDDTFAGGRSFHYGCLHIGGTGATIYGEYCVVLRADALAAAGALMYLRHDSAKDYVDATGTVDLGRIASDTAPHDARHLLAALKCEADLTDDASAWPKVLCSDAGYIEAIFAKADVKGDIAAIRIGRKRHAELYDLIVERYRRALSALEKAVIDDFATVLSLMQGADLKFEVLND